MEGTGPVHLNQHQVMQTYIDQGVPFQVTFGSKGEVTLAPLKDAQPTVGLKAPDSHAEELSVPKKIPLSRRSATKAAAEDTSTIREAVFNKLKSAKAALKKKFPAVAKKLERLATSANKTFSEIKKAVKHENWMEITEETMKNCSDELKSAMELYNQNIEKFENLKKEKSANKEELNALNAEYKNTLKLYTDPRGVIDSKKSITFPIPVEGHAPYVIQSSYPSVRAHNVNQVIKLVDESGLHEKMDKLESEIKNARTERDKLKNSLKESGNKIIEMYQSEHGKRLKRNHDNNKAKQDALTKQKSDMLDKQRNILKCEVTQLSTEIDDLKNERKTIQGSLLDFKRELSRVKKTFDAFDAFDAVGKNLSSTSSGRGGGTGHLIEAQNQLTGYKQNIEKMRNSRNDRLMAISGELKKKESELKTKKKMMKDLDKGKKPKKPEKSDAREEPDTKLAGEHKEADKVIDAEDTLTRQLDK